VSDLLVGLLSAVLATNAPQAVSNFVAEKTGIAIPVLDTNDPVEAEYYKVLLDDDAAEKDVLHWTDDAEAFDKAAGHDPKVTLHLKIQHRLEAVRHEYENFLQKHPDHVNGHLAFGSFLNDIHDEDGAVNHWDTARRLAPRNPAAWNNLANYYGHRGPLTNAFEYYAKAIELDPNESVYYHNLAVTIYLFRKDAGEYFKLTEAEVFDKALELYREAIKLAPDDFVLYSDYAECFYGTNPPRWKDGLEAWTGALKIAHDEDELEGVYIHLARINLKLGNYDQVRMRLSGVTNQEYAILKNRILANLNEAIAKDQTNTSPKTAQPTLH
jgi:tetratricopeptide (TPR) repeat protein